MSPDPSSPLPTLFPLPAPSSPAVVIGSTDPKRGARLRRAERSQIAWGRIDLDAQMPDDHPVRAIWAVVGKLDLSALYAQIEARDEVAGASAIDPTILLMLWVYGTSECEGSARDIWRGPKSPAANRRSGGRGEVAHHTLSSCL